MKWSGTLGALKQMVIDDLHTPGIDDLVRRKCIQAMRFHRDKRFYFSDRECRFTLTAGRQIYRPGDGYGLPADLVEVASKVIWILIGGSEDMRTPCHRVTADTFDVSRVAWGNSQSQPEEWDFRLGGLRFSPPSQTGTDVAELRYLANITFPLVNYELGAYVYYHPETRALLTTAQVDAWTNDWLEQEKGFGAIYARTKYAVAKEYLRDMELANDELATWLEMVGQLEAETESKVSGMSELPGTILGGGDWGEDW
jgi:hypothetical protein